MDKRLELIDAFMKLSKQLERVCKLLSSEEIVRIIGCVKDDSIIEDLDKTVALNISDYLLWPPAVTSGKSEETKARSSAMALPNLNDLSVLEYSRGYKSPIAHLYNNAKVDLISDEYTFISQPPNVRLIKSIEEANEFYDYGIIHESLEFESNPLAILLKLKEKCKKIVIRFKPWTSRDGGFQSGFFNKAFAQLLTDIDHKVMFKVVKPLSTYESLLTSAGLSIFEKRVGSNQIEEYITNDDILDIIIKRTWGTIDKKEAIKIMMTSHVEYVVGK